MGSSGLGTAPLHTNLVRGRMTHQPPQVSKALLRWFLRYAQVYVRRHMHTVRVSQEENVLAADGRPVLLYMNHPSWWDPMIAAVLAARYLPDYLHYTPIDSVALEQYRFFAKIGFFGLQRNGFESRRKLIEIASQVLSQRCSALWITPQSRFSDVRQRPLDIGKSLPHLVRNAPNCVVIPVAVEYAFWEERKPEALIRFGLPLSDRELQASARLPQFFELHLEETLNALNRASIERHASAFRVILSGGSGVGGFYDIWRKLRAAAAGRHFRAEHGAHSQ